MAIGELGEASPAALPGAARALYATHGLLCPCPGCKSALGGPVAGVGTLGTDLASPAPPRGALALGFRAMGLTRLESLALLRADDVRFGAGAGARVAAAQLGALQKMHVVARLARIQNWRDRCLAS